MKIFWFDVETTGLDKNKHEIIQLSYQMETDGKIVQERDLLMRPDFPDLIEPSALEVQGKTKEEILLYPDRKKQWSVFMEDLNGWIDKYDKSDKCWYGGYNVDFDIQFLWGQVRRLNQQYFGSFFNGYRVDPYSVIQFLVSTGKFPVLPKYKLELVCEKMGIELKAHDSRSDIAATRIVSRKLSELLK